MRTYAMGVADAQSKMAANGKPVSFTYGVAQDMANTLRGAYTFENGKVISFTVPSSDGDFMKGIGETVGKITGASSTPLGSGMNDVMNKLSIKNTSVVETVSTIGILPVLIVLTVIIVVGRWLYKKAKRKKKR